MKTQSLKSLVALIIAGGMLSSNVFAGPGPKGAPQETGNQTTKAAVTTIAVYPNAHSLNSKSTQTFTPRTPHLIYTAHGGVNIL